MFSLSKITSLLDLSKYLDRSLGSAEVSAKVKTQKVKSPNIICLSNCHIAMAALSTSEQTPDHICVWGHWDS